MQKVYQTLLVEDDKRIAKTLKMSLVYKGFEVTPCETFCQGIETFYSRPFDVVLLEVNLPDRSGLELCKEIRKANETVPVLLLTANITASTHEESAVYGFKCGADDYIRISYGTQELVARMLRLLEKKKGTSTAFCFGCLRVDPQKRIAWAQAVQLSLGKREFEILTLLIKKSGDVVTRNEIIHSLGEDLDIYDRTIDSHLSHLRRKLREAVGITAVQIIPIYGVGYRLELK